MQLARLGQLAFAPDGRADAAQVRQRRRVRQPVQDLRSPCRGQARQQATSKNLAAEERRPRVHNAWALLLNTEYNTHSDWQLTVICITSKSGPCAIRLHVESALHYFFITWN